MRLAPSAFNAHLTRSASVPEDWWQSTSDWVGTGGCSISPGRDFASPLSLWSGAQVQNDPRGFGWRSHADLTAPQTVMWQWPCGLNIWIRSQIILQWTSSHLSLDKLYWSLTINRVLHQLAAMPLTARGNNHICVVCRPVASLGAVVCIVIHCHLNSWKYHMILQYMKGQRSILVVCCCFFK